MHNIPDGAESDPRLDGGDEPYCPECGEVLNIESNNSGWKWLECTVCDHSETIEEGF